MLHKFGKKILTAFTSVAVLLLASPVVFAAEAIPAGDSILQSYFCCGSNDCRRFSYWHRSRRRRFGYWNSSQWSLSAVGRNPGVQGKIMMTMLVGMAMAESIAIYALVVSLVLLYANPYMRYFLG